MRSTKILVLGVFFFTLPIVGVSAMTPPPGFESAPSIPEAPSADTKNQSFPMWKNVLAGVESSAESANMRIVLEWEDLILKHEYNQAFQLYVSPSFVEHSPLVRAWMKVNRPGYKETLAFFATYNCRPAPDGGWLIQGLMVADDDIVIEMNGLGEDAFRVANGKIQEQWVGAVSPPPT